MCKFSNRLFIFALLLLASGGVLSQPLGGRPHPGRQRNVVSDLLEVLYDDYSDNSYQQEEIFYDQRQKGSENLQLSVDGVVISMAPQMGSNWLYTIAEYYLSTFSNNEPKETNKYCNIIQFIQLYYSLGEMMLRQSTPEPDTNQIYEKEPVTEMDPGAAEVITKMADPPKNDLESRQHQIIAPHNSSRTPSQLLQLLKMMKTSKV
ncbi:hypothetical protein KR074_001019 [Drosophila pseudoananassae]|nr:hypothetical protein KR074_001019 [Drosophila pseudoananassae]